MFRFKMLFLTVALITLGVPSVASAAESPTVQVTLRPAAPASSSHRIETVEVSIIEPVSSHEADAPLLRMPLVIANVKTVATVLLDLQVQDVQGDLELKYHDDTKGHKLYRHWTASRPVKGPVTITYRVNITNTPNPLGAAPPFELRSEGAAFSALAGTFLMLPDTGRQYRLELHWDFSEIDGDTLGVSTLGLGNQVTTSVQSVDKLEAVFVMGGRVGHEPRKRAVNGFFSAWQGDSPFDARALMQWTQELYGYYLKFFDIAKPTYTVFLRRNPINPGGGVGVQNSFVGTFGPRTSVSDLELTLAHEMVHTFVGHLDSKAPLADAWFSEGLAVYYERLLPWRAGLISREAYLQDINSTAARYYTDALKDTPNDQIPGRFWADTRIRVLPYDRGSLYFAQLNAEIRKASHGKRSLDDLVLQFLERRREGLSLTREAWVEAVVNEIGSRGKKQFENMLHGKPIILDSGTFGPCFRRTVVSLRRYQLGFTPDVLIEPKQIVRGLIPGSNAAKAGLQNGDEIVKPVPQDAIQADQHAKLNLTIRRDGKIQHIDYLPRGESVPAYQWVETDAPGCSGPSSPSGQ